MLILPVIDSPLLPRCISVLFVRYNWIVRPLLHTFEQHIRRRDHPNFPFKLIVTYYQVSSLVTIALVCSQWISFCSSTFVVLPAQCCFVIGSKKNMLALSLSRIRLLRLRHPRRQNLPPFGLSRVRSHSSNMHVTHGRPTLQSISHGRSVPHLFNWWETQHLFCLNFTFNDLYIRLPHVHAFVNCPNLVLWLVRYFASLPPWEFMCRCPGLGPQPVWIFDCLIPLCCMKMSNLKLR